MSYTRVVRPVEGESLHRAPVVTAKIYPSQFEELEALTASSGQTRSALIRHLIADEIERHKVLIEP